MVSNSSVIVTVAATVKHPSDSGSVKSNHLNKLPSPSTGGSESSTPALPGTASSATSHAASHKICPGSCSCVRGEYF